VLRAYHALAPMTAPDGLPTNAVFGLAGLLHRLVFEDRPDFLAIVFDAPDDSRTTFRSSLYPAYKANRSARPADLTAQMPYLRDLARAFGLTPLEDPAFEADDLVAALVGGAEARGLETTVLSADKDLMQLVSDRTTLWDSMRGRRYTPAAVKEKLGVAPPAVADYLALVGDSSDNVPGVAGIGPKSAARLLEAHGDLDGIFAHLDELPARERARLETCRELAYLSRSLTRLAADAPLPCPFDDFALKAPPIAALAELFARLGLRSLPLPQQPPAHALAPDTRIAQPAPRPAPAPARPRRLRPSPSELARLIGELDPAHAPRVELTVHGDSLELTLSDLVLEVSLRAPSADRKGMRMSLQPSLFETPTPLSGPELAELLLRHLGPDAAHLGLIRGDQREPALAALRRWGAT
jgi:DNA polymerase-1